MVISIAQSVILPVGSLKVSSAGLEEGHQNLRVTEGTGEEEDYTEMVSETIAVHLVTNDTSNQLLVGESDMITQAYDYPHYTILTSILDQTGRCKEHLKNKMQMTVTLVFPDYTTEKVFPSISVESLKI